MLKRRRAFLTTIVLFTLTFAAACNQAPLPDQSAPLDGRGGGFIAFHSYRDGNSEIYVMNADGSGPKRLTSDPGEDSCPNLARDASAILFTSTRDGISEVYSIGLDGKDLRRLTETEAKEMHPVWTPDGARVVYARDGDIWIMDADGQNQTQLTHGLRAELPFVTADGQRILFSDMAAGNYDVYVLNIDGGEVTPVAVSADMEVYGSPAPDGNRLALMRAGRNIWVMGLDGSGAARLRTGAENPCWSPDGANIAFHSETGNYEIYRMSADGRNAVNLTRNSGNDFWPSWAKKPMQ